MNKNTTKGAQGAPGINTHPRTIKSFVRRQRRLTSHQEKIFAKLWPVVGIVFTEKKLDFKKIFNRDAEKICEIGFGHGDSLWPMAKANPECDYLGIEVHTPGTAELLCKMDEENIQNIRVIEGDAVLVMRDLIPDHSFSRIHIFFSDPWPKSRHHKRRLIQTDFIDLLIHKLTPNGVLHFATDWEHYAHQMMTLLSDSKKLKNCMGEHQFANNEKLKLRANTKFENRGRKLGHDVWDLLFQKITH